MQERVFGSIGGLWRFRSFLNHFADAAEQIIQRERIEVLLGHWLVPTGIVMKKLARRHRLPMILSSHGSDIRLVNKNPGLVYPYFRRFGRQLKQWTVVSSFLREQILRWDSSLKDIVQVLPLPHDESVFFRDTSVHRDDTLVVAVTRFTEQKRVMQLVRAFVTVVRSVPNAKLEIYGSGQLQSEAERLIQSLNLQNTVSIKTPVPQNELRTVYNRAAIVVLNSFQEGFGLALSEAMMCGAAVIGTDSGGIPDIIQQEKTGLLVPVDNTAALSQAIVKLLRERNLRTRLAESGFQTARQRYASGPLAEEYASMIRETSSSDKRP
jgi:glycosyltransferase involved in cell wall biosynthesis